MSRELVSIITPVYNAEKYIEETIRTVQEQTYDNWELLLVDDCSTDKSIEVITKYTKNDKRIKLVKLKKNSGSAKARNTAIEKSKGRYLAFLDADDLWIKEKLEKQLRFINEKNAAFIYASYEFADEMGKPNGKKVIVPEKINYNKALKNLIIWTSTVIIDTNKIDRDIIRMPNVKRGQDMATWWKLLKKIDYAYGMREIVAYYRRYSGSLSSNKIKALKRTWILYRKVEKMSILESMSNFIPYILNAIKKRI